MKKKLLAILLACAMLLSLLPVTALADDQADTASAQTTMAASGTCGENVYWTLDDAGTLTISGTGDMYDYDSILDVEFIEYAAPWYESYWTVQKVVIGDGVTSIGDSAFYLCENLKSVTIPESVTSIGGCAFDSCNSLSRITLPAGLTELGDNAFSSCESLQRITIPAGVTVIDSGTFSSCLNLKSVRFLGKVTMIGDSAFAWCTSLTDIDLPDSLTFIDDSAFLRCSSLVSITIPNSVCILGGMAFMGCTSLRSVVLTKGIAQIADFTFCDCSSLEDVYYAGTKQLLQVLPIGSDNDGWDNATIHCCADNGSYTDSPFSDVQNIWQYYFVPVLWAQDQGFAQGTSATTFSPDGACTRAQAVTFLYRLEGEPAVSGSNPFKDVKTSDYYYDAVRWASQKGITFGTSETTFSPNEPVTRGEFITFLGRYAKIQDDAGCNYYFWDVVPGDYFAASVAWGYENGIVAGTGYGTFSPNNACTRGQVMTFLWRYAENQVISDRDISTEPGYGAAPENYLPRTASVSSGMVALRSEKSSDDSNVIGFIDNGATVYVVDNTEGQYWYVYVPDLEMYGYVNSDYLR